MMHFYRQLKQQIRKRGLLGLLAKIFLVMANEGVRGMRLRMRRTALLNMNPAILPGNTDSSLWIRLFERPDEAFYAHLTARASLWARPPRISLLMPVYNTPEAWLRQAIDSVIQQVYQDWELCIADDASTQPHVRNVLEEYRQRDARIKVVYRETNGHVSAASNSALALVTGEFTVLFDHDDLLERQALYRVAESILADWPDIIYSDELLISEASGEVIGHAFRPAFSLELLRAHAYIVHLVAFRTALLRCIGGFDESLTISQDYDLILRAAERAKTIVHIPEALYRWRTHAASTGHRKQSDVMETSRRVLAAHLARCGEDAAIEDGRVFNFFDVRYPLTPGLRVAILIPTKNNGELVRQCVESIARTAGNVAYDIVVIDHASDDPASMRYFASLSKEHTLLRYEGKFNFSAINNWAAGQLDRNKYSHYLLCNNDIEAIEPGWLERMLELGQKPDVGIVGAKLYYPDHRTLQHAGVCVGMFRMAEHFGKFMDRELPDGRGIHPGYLGSLIANREMSAVTAACLLIRRDAFEWLGGFDENIAVGFGDVDLCLRARQSGFRVLFCPHAELIHHESYSRGKTTTKADPHPEDSLYFRQRWQWFIDNGDPYYNPHLTLYNTYWDLKGPEEYAQEGGRRESRRVFRKHPGFRERF
jgi:GT2 family glycosyltransferase